MSQRILVAVVLLLSAAASPAAQDNRIVGAWKAVTYEISGTPHPMQGLFIFTKNYYSANVRFKLGSRSHRRWKWKCRPLQIGQQANRVYAVGADTRTARRRKAAGSIARGAGRNE